MTHAALKDLTAAKLVERVRNALESHRKGLPEEWQDFIAEQVRDLSNAIAAISAMEGEAVAWRDDIKTLIDNGQVWHDASQDEACAYVAARDRLMKASGYGDTAPPPQQAVVPQCKHANTVLGTDGVRFCNVCGAPVPVNPTPSPGPQGGGEALATDEVLVAITRGEGYEDVAPELVAEDALGLSNPFSWRVIAAPPAHQPGEVDMELVEEGLRYFEMTGDKGDERYTREIRKAFAALAPKEAGHDR